MKTLLILFFSLFLLHADDSDAEKQNLINQIMKIRRQENEIIDNLEKLERNIRITEDKISSTQNIISALEKDIEKLELSVSETREKLSLHRQSFFHLLKNAWSGQKNSLIAYLFSSQSTGDFLRRAKYMQFLGNRQEKMLSELLLSLRQIEKQKTDLAYRREEVTFHNGELVFNRKYLLKSRTEKEDILDKIRQKQDELQKKYEQFQRGSEKIASVIQSPDSVEIVALPAHTEEIAEKEIVSTPEIASEETSVAQSLDLIWPAGDINSVISFYGNQKNQFKNSFFNTGIRIACALDFQIKAAASGKVMYKGAVEGYGNVLIIDHGSGYTSLYANLKEILVGINEQINAGDKIATVEENQDLHAGVLHFEVRKKGEPCDPLKWL